MQDTRNYDALQTLKQIYEMDLSLAQKRLEELDPIRQELIKLVPLTPDTDAVISSMDEMIKTYNTMLMNAQFNLTLISHEVHKIESHLTN